MTEPSLRSPNFVNRLKSPGEQSLSKEYFHHLTPHTDSTTPSRPKPRDLSKLYISQRAEPWFRWAASLIKIVVKDSYNGIKVRASGKLVSIASSYL